MAIILGLDVSTSVTGVCVVDSDVMPDEKGSHILYLDRIEFGSVKMPSGKVPACASLWEKADRVKYAMEFVARFLSDKFVDRIVLEEPLMGFRPGMSSAQTITQLMRFNGVVSYIARNTFQKEPEYIGSAHARKLCGMKLQRTAIAGPQKEQVFTYMAANDLKHVQWPLKKNGKVVDWSRDACDAYVIARAAAIAGPIISAVKKPKQRKALRRTI